MLKIIVASFFGTFLALAAIGGVAVVAADRAVDRMAANVAGRIEARISDVQEQVASVAARLNERAGNARALTGAGESEPGRRALLAAFGECVETYADTGEAPATVVKRCLDEHAR